MQELDVVVAHLDAHDHGTVLGLYLYGSAVTSGLRPDSDLDLLLLTRESLSTTERTAMTSLLLHVSGWRGHAERFPDAADRRPVELTSLVVGMSQPWTPTPHRDFQYGEWLRAELLTGTVPQPADDPDVVTLLAMAHQAHRTLLGRPLSDLVAPVPAETLRTAVVRHVPELLRDLPGDERNVLLTLARVLVTLRTGRIVSKDDAAQEVAPSLNHEHRELLTRARAGYLGHIDDDWSEDVTAAQELARALAGQAEQRP